MAGGWNFELQQPEGTGTMRWDNGISYEGEWKAGKYHGFGKKLYSRGGGYEGEWIEGLREGQGVSFFDGKFGVARWEGSFHNNVPHGKGQLYYFSEAEDEHGRWEGDLAVKGPMLEFRNGTPLLSEAGLVEVGGKWRQA